MYRFANKVTINGRDYLDKIIQIPFFLPPVSYKKLKESFTTGGKGDALAEEIWNIVRLGMDGNPRKTKRFVNCFYLLQQLLKDPARSGYDQVAAPLPDMRTQNIYLAKILVFQMNFPDFYMNLQLYPGDWEYLEKDIIEANSTEDRANALLIRPELEPFLKKNPHLIAFVRKTAASKGDPGPPREEIVSQLLQITNLVRSGGFETSFSDIRREAVEK